MIAKDVMRTEFLRIDKTATVSEFIGLLRNYKQDVALVFDEKKFLGVSVLKNLLRCKIETQIQGMKDMIWHVPHLNMDTDLIDIATLMFHSKSRILPVIENDKVIGVVKSDDILKQLSTIKELKQLKVRDIRHPRVMTIRETDKLSKAFEILSHEDITRLAVVDDSRKLVGVLSYIDIIERYFSHPIRRDKGSKGKIQSRAFKAENPDLLSLPVSNFEIRTDIITGTEDTSLLDIADMMVKNRISSVIIAQAGEPKSIVTKRDLLEVIMNTKKEEVMNIQYDGLTKLDELTPHEKDYIMKLCSFYAEKILFHIKDYDKIHVHFKRHKSAGKLSKKHKYAVHVKVSCPTLSIASSKATDWDLPRTVHKAFNDVEKQIIHRFRSDKSYKRGYE